MVQKPGFIPNPTNMVNSDEPITISGVAIGKNMSEFISPCPLNAYLPIAKAISVPSKVAIVVEIKPILSELPSALHTSAAPHGFFQFLIVKPRQTKLDLPESLNEKTIV